MPAQMAQSSAADFHEQKIMDLRMGYVLGNESGPSVTAHWLFQRRKHWQKHCHLLLSEEMGLILNYIQQGMTSFL